MMMMMMKKKKKEKKNNNNNDTNTYVHTSNPYLKNTPRGGKRMANSTSMKVQVPFVPSVILAKALGQLKIT